MLFDDKKKFHRYSAQRLQDKESLKILYAYREGVKCLE